VTLAAQLRRTFAALGVRNYRLYFTGQFVSVVGTWMQRVAQSWLVLELTGSGTAVGAVTALQFLPILLIAPAGGLVADRMDKRTLLYITQILSGITAAVLGILVLTDRVELWMVYALAFALGLVGSFDNPARRAFVVEMVGRASLTNALGLNSVMVNSARIAGPALGGLLIVTVGLGTLFLLNAASYLALILAMSLMRQADLSRSTPLARGRGQLREAIRYIRSVPVLYVNLVQLAVLSVFGYEYEVILPLMARFVFDGDADTFGIMFAAVGGGAVAGGLIAANRNDPAPRTLYLGGVAFAGALLIASVAPVLWTELIALAVVGLTGTSLLTLGSSLLQLNTRPEMQGRVLALHAVAFVGARPIGGPVIGWMGEHLGPRVAMAVGSIAVLLASVWASRRLSVNVVSSDTMVD